MSYPRSIKQSVLKQVLPPVNQSIGLTSKETGISDGTIRNWIRENQSGLFDNNSNEKSPRQYSNKEKYHMLIEAAKISEDNFGAFLRENGLHTEHLTLWDQEIRDAMTMRDNQNNKKEKQLQKRIRELEKELVRKDKALAETTALLVLKKKLNAIMEGHEDD